MRRVLMLILMLASFCGLLTGCQSVSGSAAGSSSGTPLGVSTLTITAASYVDNTVVSHSVYLTVNVLPPGSTGYQPAGGAQ
jgi:ABC-type Fe3+-hydroxamate transport system substrate-binding protein